MRKALRLLAPALTAAVIALGSATSALAAATPTKESLEASWCFNDVTVTYCFEVTGFVHYLDNSAGSSVTSNQTTRTSFYQNGEYIGSSKTVEQLRGVFQNDGTVVLQSSMHVQSRLGDEKCTYHMVVRIADFDVVVDHVNSTCGG